MAEITLKGNPIHTLGQLPAKGTSAPDFKLVKNDLSEVSKSDVQGKNVILNIFPSVDTPTCALSTKQFNERASQLDNAVVLCVSADLPFAQKRFCAAEGIDKVDTVSSFRSSFGQDYGVTIEDGPIRGLLSRAVVILNPKGEVIYTEQVSEVGSEPNYDAAIAAL